MPEMKLIAPSGVTKVQLSNGHNAIVNGGIVSVDQQYVSEVMAMGFNPIFQPDLGFEWANKPGASGCHGARIYITDVGVGGSWWYSNGVRWRPVSHSLCLLTFNGGVNGLLFDSTLNAETDVPGSVTLPGGVIQPGDNVRFLARMVITGPGGTGNAGTGTRIAKVRLGAGILVAVNNGANGAVVNWSIDKHASILSNTTVRYAANSIFSGSSNTSGDVVNVANDFSADGVLKFTTTPVDTATAGDEAAIIVYSAAAYLECAS